MDDKASAIGLAGKVLQNGGVLGLIAVMGVAFLMLVVYQGQEKLIEIGTKQTDLLTDIRYAIRADKGMTFRDTDN